LLGDCLIRNKMAGKKVKCVVLKSLSGLLNLNYSVGETVEFTQEQAIVGIEAGLLMKESDYKEKIKLEKAAAAEAEASEAE